MNSKFFRSNKFAYIVLGLILILSAFIRLYQLGVVPPSPDWDEVALGYNAYSIMQTGKDEYGKFIPVVLRSFDDYKPALYAYLIIPFIKLFGLSIIAVRLPSVIFGLVGILAVFFIIKELFEHDISVGKITIPSHFLALLATFLAAISPWHIQFSRVAFEANVGLTFNLLVVLFFLKGLKRTYLLPLSAFFGALNLYMYQSEKVYTPLLFLILVIVYWKKLFKLSKKWIMSSIVIGVLVAFPMAMFIITNPNSLSRAKGVSVFSDTTKLLAANTEKVKQDIASHDYLGLLIDNRRIDYVKAFVAGYLSHFEPNWLFYEGDVSRHHAPYMGLLYLFELPFILIGLYILLFCSVDKKTKWFVVLFILIAPIPAAITIDVPHAVRTINFIPSFDLLSALGIFVFAYWVVKKRFYIQIPVFGIVGLFVLLNTLYYFNQYFVQQNYFDSKYWQYAWQEAVAYTAEQARGFDHVVVSNQPPLDQSYMFYLYYLKYDPALYLEQGGTKSGGYNKEHTAFDKYIFRPINWEQDKLMQNTLFVGTPGDLPVNIAKTVYYLNGDPAIIVSRKYQ